MKIVLPPHLIRSAVMDYVFQISKIVLAKKIVNVQQVKFVVMVLVLQMTNVHVKIMKIVQTIKNVAFTMDKKLENAWKNVHAIAKKMKIV